MWSWWQSLESVERFNSWMYIGLITSAALVTVFTAFTWLSGRQITRLQQQQDRVERARAVQREAEIRKQLAGAQEKKDAAERELHELQARQQPRQLSAEQRERFQAIIREWPKRSIYIASPSGDREAFALVEQLVSIFSSEGWQTGLPLSPVYFVPAIEGIIIQASDLEATQPYISVVQRAFEAIDMPVKIEMDDSGLRGTLNLFVGHKPSR